MFNPCPASACFLLPPKSHQRTPCFLPFCGCQSSTRALPQISFPWKTQCPRYPGLAEKMLRCEPSGSLVTGMTPAPITQLGHGMAKVHPMRSVRKAVIYIYIYQFLFPFTLARITWQQNGQKAACRLVAAYIRPVRSLVCADFALLRNAVLLGHLRLAEQGKRKQLLLLSQLMSAPVGTPPPHHPARGSPAILLRPCHLSCIAEALTISCKSRSLASYKAIVHAGCRY